MLNDLIVLILLTLTPALELRASIPYGIIVGLPWLLVFVVAVVTNIILGVVVYFILDKFMHLLLKIGAVARIWEKIVARTQRKIEPYVEKYGEWGLALFIGIPLPGSGVYTGAIAAYLLGIDKKRFFGAVVGGVLIAGVLVTLIVVSGSEAFSFFVK
ncbi:MAG: small multi-drug export protein [Candidatus Woesearchaeota archaeon]|jgi:uncharacterized membrane protein|nr:small multi-drug export protein [Candidatus Woesearchaeota archaeon]MDP7324117.1 small multi-drug export protein [Candidatus Woesearchaeota archaeon]MDP7457165.1 small multi-drug export protein [Candidatus Woesearchaeota archaeon]